MEILLGIGMALALGLFITREPISITLDSFTAYPDTLYTTTWMGADMSLEDALGKDAWRVLKEANIYDNETKVWYPIDEPENYYLRNRERIQLMVASAYWNGYQYVHQNTVVKGFRLS